MSTHQTKCPMELYRYWPEETLNRLKGDLADLYSGKILSKVFNEIFYCQETLSKNKREFEVKMIFSTRVIDFTGTHAGFITISKWKPLNSELS